MKSRIKAHLHTVKAEALALSEERSTFFVLAAVLALSFALYAYFVHETIQNVAARQRLETEMSVLNTRIGELEFKYISMKNDITIDQAYALGFKDVAEMKFVSRKSLTHVVVNNMN